MKQQLMFPAALLRLSVTSRETVLEFLQPPVTESVTTTQTALNEITFANNLVCVNMNTLRLTQTFVCLFEEYSLTWKEYVTESGLRLKTGFF